MVVVAALAGVGTASIVGIAAFWLYVEFWPRERARTAPKRDGALLAPLFVARLREAAKGVKDAGSSRSVMYV